MDEALQTAAWGQWLISSLSWPGLHLSQNQWADFLAREVLERQQPFEWWHVSKHHLRTLWPQASMVDIHFDGGCRHGAGSAGASLALWKGDEQTRVFSKGMLLNNATNNVAELFASKVAISCLYVVLAALCDVM